MQWLPLQSFIFDAYIILCWVSSNINISLPFRLEKGGGLAHDRMFVCSVQVENQNGTFVTVGDPMSRVKDAENSAAQKMLELLLQLWDRFMYMARSFVTSFGEENVLFEVILWQLCESVDYASSILFILVQFSKTMNLY